MKKPDLKNELLYLIALSKIDEAHNLFLKEAKRFKHDAFLDLLDIGFTHYSSLNEEDRESFGFFKFVCATFVAISDDDILDRQDIWFEDPFMRSLACINLYFNRSEYKGENKYELFDLLTESFERSYNEGCDIAKHFYYISAPLNMDSIGSTIYTDEFNDRLNSLKQDIKECKEDLLKVEYFTTEKEERDFTDRILELQKRKYDVLRLPYILNAAYDDDEADACCIENSGEISKAIDEVKDLFNEKKPIDSNNTNQKPTDKKETILKDGLYSGYTAVSIDNIKSLNKIYDEILDDDKSSEKLKEHFIKLYKNMFATELYLAKASELYLYNASGYHSISQILIDAKLKYDDFRNVQQSIKDISAKFVEYQKRFSVLTDTKYTLNNFSRDYYKGKCEFTIPEMLEIVKGFFKNLDEDIYNFYMEHIENRYITFNTNYYGVCYAIDEIKQSRICVRPGTDLEFAFTIVHEFGHAYANSKRYEVGTYDDDLSDSIPETQSLYFETLFADYIITHNEEFGITKEYAISILLSTIYTNTINSLIYIEYEKRLVDEYLEREKQVPYDELIELYNKTIEELISPEFYPGNVESKIRNHRFISSPYYSMSYFFGASVGLLFAAETIKGKEFINKYKEEVGYCPKYNAMTFANKLGFDTSIQKTFDDIFIYVSKRIDEFLELTDEDAEQIIVGYTNNEDGE